MYLFYVVTTNILLCIFSFFADVLSYDNTFLLFYFFTFKSPFLQIKRECVPYVYATTNGTHPQYSYSKIERVYLKYISRSFPYLRTFA